MGIKQLEETPFTQYAELNKKGDVVKGKVIEIEEKKVVIELAEEVHGHLRSNELNKGKVNSMSEVFNMAMKWKHKSRVMIIKHV